MNSVQTKNAHLVSTILLTAEFIIRINLLQVSKKANGFLSPKSKIAIICISTCLLYVYDSNKPL